MEKKGVLVYSKNDRDFAKDVLERAATLQRISSAVKEMEFFDAIYCSNLFNL